jgi:hypothetical protein
LVAGQAAAGRQARAEGSEPTRPLRRFVPGTGSPRLPDDQAGMAHWPLPFQRHEVDVNDPGVLDQPRQTDLAAVRQQLRTFAALVGATLIVSWIALPWQLAAGLFAVASIVLGARLLVAMRRAQVRGLGPLLAGVGVALSTLTIGYTVSALILWPMPLQLQTCLGEALTVSGEHRCVAQFQDQVFDRFSVQLPD